MTRTSTINQLIDLLHGALHRLGHCIAMPEAEVLASRIHRAMDSPNRAYHTSRHVLDVCGQQSPIGDLAALYHDVAYYQLDGGFPAHLGDWPARFIERRDSEFILRLPPDAPLPVRLVAAVFGYGDGAQLPLQAGLNELASALIALQQLGAWLTSLEMLGVAACIEATVPFRAPDADARRPPEILLARLTACNEAFALGASAAALQSFVAESVAMANRDVAGFAEQDATNFLANTWLLIEESNAALVAVGLYSIQDYRRALARMQAFLSHLDPAHIFQAHAGTPSADEQALLTAAARNNLQFAQRYLAGKLATIAIVEALALASGGDCPVSMMLGDIRSSNLRPVRIEDFLPEVQESELIDQELLAAFVLGRRSESLRDLVTSPLTAFVYRVLGEAGMLALFERGRALFAGEIGAMAFLSQLPGELRQPILEGCARIAVSRREALRSLIFL